MLFFSGSMARPVEIEVPIMVLFTMSRAGALIMKLNGIPAKMNKTLAIGCVTWFDCVIRQDVSILKRG
jgi:hypothetical protein